MIYSTEEAKEIEVQRDGLYVCLLTTVGLTNLLYSCCLPQGLLLLLLLLVGLFYLFHLVIFL